MQYSTTVYKAFFINVEGFMDASAKKFKNNRASMQ